MGEFSIMKNINRNDVKIGARVLDKENMNNILPNHENIYEQIHPLASSTTMVGNL